MWIVPPNLPMIETVVAPEISVRGIGAIEYVNGWLRIYLYAEEVDPGFSGAPKQRILKVKLLGPICQVPTCMAALAQCLVWSPPTAPGDPQPPDACGGKRPLFVVR